MRKSLKTQIMTYDVANYVAILIDACMIIQNSSLAHTYQLIND